MVRAWLPWSLAACATFANVWQDPEKVRPAPPPAAAPALPPIDEPFVTPVPRLDLQPRALPRDPLEGFYQLRERVVAGRHDATRSSGWLAIGRQHIFLHLVAAGPDPGIPLLRVGVRRWERNGDRLRMTVLSGHFNEADGDIQIEQAGLVETRRFELLDAVLRVHQSEGDYLEFVRIE